MTANSQAKEISDRAHKTVCVIDGNSLMHRAFHAVPPTMHAPDGTPTNALFGFLSMFLKMVEIFNPDAVVCAFDKGKPQARMDILPQYKAQRPAVDPDLRAQFPLIKDVLQTLSIPVVECEGWEGDDILGTLAKRGEALDYSMLLITGDRDMYQLTSPLIKIVATHKGMTDISIMTPETVEKTYHGITPELVPDFYGLKGDSSDNIPGVPGIGPKRASELIVRYGSLEAVLEHADEIKGKMGENLRAHMDDARLSKQVATIKTDAPVTLDLTEISFPSYTQTTAVTKLKGLGFTTLTKRFASLVDKDEIEDEDTLEAKFQEQKPQLPVVFKGSEAVSRLQEMLNSSRLLSVVCDCSKPEELLFVLDYRMYVTDGDCAVLLEEQTVIEEAIKSLLKRGNVVCENVKELVHSVYPHDHYQNEMLLEIQAFSNKVFDVSLAAYLVDSNLSDPTFEKIVERYVPFEQVNASDPEYLLIKSVVLLKTQDVLREKLEACGGVKLLERVEVPLAYVLAYMESLGMYVNSRELANQSESLGQELEAIREDLYAQAGVQFNIDSPMQLSNVLFEVLKLPTTGLKKTKSGYYSTNAKILEGLAATHKIVRDVLDYREKTKIKSTYLDSLAQLISNWDGRIHTTFNQTITATGRLSSSNPNLQNIPVRSELGKKVRQAFCVEEDHVFLSCDYSQIELRLLAHLSEDKHLCDAFLNGADFHKSTAARVFGVGLDAVTPELRRAAKAVNFGIVYGQQAFGLSQTLHISRPEAQEMIDRYFRAYPQVRAYLDDIVAFAKRHEWVQTMYGRRRYVPEINAKNFQLRSFAERTAMNHPMQGSAADIIKLAMIQIARVMSEEKLKTKLILQIHDELDFEVPQNELERVEVLVRKTMESVVTLRVPLIADASFGKTWADAK